MVEQNIIVVPLVVEWKTRKKQQRKMLSSADLSHAKDAIKHKNTPASAANTSGAKQSPAGLSRWGMDRFYFTMN